MLKIYIGWDSREPIAYDVCEHSIKRRARGGIEIIPLKHKELRQLGILKRPVLIESDTGNFRDLMDNRPISTEFTFTRFFVPHLSDYKGWAVFMDCDMIALEDLRGLLDLCNDKYAVIVRKHNHRPANTNKMDDREQYVYDRKNWSSFILFNCGHPSNKALTADYVNTASGRELHQFAWLKDSEIGELPAKYNWIENFSPPIEGKPAVIHYTEGGPWFIDKPQCQSVMYADDWWKEYDRYMHEGDKFSMLRSGRTATKKDLLA